MICRPIGVPARRSRAEHGERAQALESRGAGAAARPARACASSRSRPRDAAVAGDERAFARRPAGGAGRTFERQPQALIRRSRAPSRRAARAQLVRQLGGVPPRIARRAARAGEARSRLERAQRDSTRAARRIAAPTRCASAIDARDELVFAGDDHLGGRRWRGRAQVGDEVGDRDVGLVADGGDRRHRAAGDRARDDLLVERPEILDRAAAAADDDDVDAAGPGDGADAARDVERRRRRPARASGE